MLVGLACAHGVAAADARLTNLRMSANDERSRLVFDLDGAVSHEVFTLSDPHRMVIDIDDVRLQRDLPAEAPSPSLIRHIRSARRNGNDLRVVLDLRSAARPSSESSSGTSIFTFTSWSPFRAPSWTPWSGMRKVVPLSVPGGILIVDDYGHWKGARRAVDEYLDRRERPPFLHRIDYTGRIAVKPPGGELNG